MVQRDRTRQRVLGSQLRFAVVDQGVAGVGFLLSLGDCPWSNPSSAATETPPTTLEHISCLGQEYPSGLEGPDHSAQPGKSPLKGERVWETDWVSPFCGSRMAGEPSVMISGTLLDCLDNQLSRSNVTARTVTE